MQLRCKRHGPNCMLGKKRVKEFLCGCSSMVERQLPKLHTRVRFPSPAPLSARPCPIRRRRVAHVVSPDVVSLLSGDSFVVVNSGVSIVE